jgi:AraC-like DNA-binding protein
MVVIRSLFGERMNQTSINAALDSRVTTFMSLLRDHGNIESMFDILPDIYFYVKDADCQFVLCNDATLQLFNLKRKSDIIGKTEYEFFPKKMADPIHKDDENVVRNNQKIVNRTELIVDDQGGLVWVSTNKIPIYGYLGEVLGLMGTTRVLRRQDMLPDTFRHFAPVIEYIQKNYHKPIEVSYLSELCCLSESQFRKRFRQLFSLPPHQFIIKVRIQAACHLLKTTNEGLCDIAIKTGFCDQSYFTRQFRSFLALSPKKYRDRWSLN